jgi:hypothetical protein
MNPESAKRVGLKMNIAMGLLMSFSMSLIGNLTSGHFQIIGFLISFVISTIISIIIGFIIPMGRLGAALCKMCRLKQGSMGARVLESIVSDIIYTPVLTAIMVGLAYMMVMKQSGGMAPVTYGQMFLGSFFICLGAGFVIIFIFQPIFLKMFMKKEGIGGPRE